MRRRGNATQLCRKGDHYGGSNVNYFGGVVNGVEWIASINGSYTYRVGSRHSGDAANAPEKTINETMRELESEFQHIQRRIKEIKS